MSVATAVTLGYGAFGSVHLVPTAGLGAATTPADFRLGTRSRHVPLNERAMAPTFPPPADRHSPPNRPAVPE